jgi:hypothetical protein
LLDILGVTRSTTAPTLGAYENGACPIGNKLYVDSSVVASGNGSSWANAINNIETALTLANTCSNIDTIWVAKGTYYPLASIGMRNNLAIIGGFSGTETLLSQRNFITNITTINGVNNGGHSVFYNNNLSNTAYLDGVTITGANNLNASGGGMYNNNSSPKINNCVFKNNLFKYGGGLYNISASNPLVTNCIFTQNYADDAGGAIMNSTSSPQFINCIITNNTSAHNGAGIFNQSNNVEIINCTITNNVSVNASGGAIFNFNIINQTIKNNIIWGNTSASGSIIYNYNSTPNITYSFVQGGYTGTGNSNANPLFTNSSNPIGADGLWFTTDDGLQVTLCSPALLAGTSIGTPSLDIMSNARNSTNPTIGAYENINDFYLIAQASINNASSIAGTSQQVFTQSDGTVHHYTDSNCNIIATIIDSLGGNVLNSITAYVIVDTSVNTYNGQPYCRRHYEITPTSQGSALVSLYLTQADFDDYNANNGTSLDLPTGPTDVLGITNVRITQVHGTGGLGVGVPQVITPILTWNASKLYWKAAFTVDSFSQFYFHAQNINNSPLPISLLSFTGKKEVNANNVYWTTSFEHNNAYFNLLRSIDATDFNVIAKLNTKAINGNSSDLISYEFKDVKFNEGHNYYKLQQVSFDNKIVESNVIDLYRDANGNMVNIYPNPTSKIINIKFIALNDEVSTMKIIDMSGRIVQLVQAKTVSGSNTIQIDISTLANGIYTLKLFNDTNLISTHKIEKK